MDLATMAHSQCCVLARWCLAVLGVEMAAVAAVAAAAPSSGECCDGGRDWEDSAGGGKDREQTMLGRDDSIRRPLAFGSDYSDF